MQYHYVVMYDSDSDSWRVEPDPEAYFSDGNIWSDTLADEQGSGWFFPEEGSFENSLDIKCWQMIYNLCTIWPSPVVEGKL